MDGYDIAMVINYPFFSFSSVVTSVVPTVQVSQTRWGDSGGTTDITEVQQYHGSLILNMHRDMNKELDQVFLSEVHKMRTTF